MSLRCAIRSRTSRPWARQHQRNLAHFSSPVHRQYLRNAGHFEFGCERIPITISAEKTYHIQTLWGEGRDAEGWAEYWNAIYAWTYEEVLGHDALRTRCLVVPFEQLCAAAEQKIADILAFCNLDADEAWVQGWGRASCVSAPIRSGIQRGRARRYHADMRRDGEELWIIASYIAVVPNQYEVI